MFALSPNLFFTLSTISDADFRVKVKIWTLSAVVIYSIRNCALAIIVFVFPQPAPARINTCPPSQVAALFCSLFKSSSKIILFSEVEVKLLNLELFTYFLNLAYLIIFYINEMKYDPTWNYLREIGLDVI